jgi:hypothetical protein
MTPGQKATADEYTIEAFDWFEAAGDRFAGVGLEYRRLKPAEWLGQWRAQMVASKNERSSYRITAYGESAYDAIANLRGEVEKEDRR